MSFSVAAVRASSAVLVSGVLVVTMVAPVQAAEQPPVFDPGLVLQAPASTPADEATPTIPEGDFSVEDESDAASPVGASARVVEPLDLSKVDLGSLEVVDRDEFSTAYELPNGLKLATVGQTPQNVLVDGDWVPVDESLARVAGGWEAAAHPLAPEFSQRSGGDIVEVSSGEYSLSWRLLGAADVRGSVGMYRDGDRGRHRRPHRLGLPEPARGHHPASRHRWCPGRDARQL